MPRNPDGLACDHNLFRLTPKDPDDMDGRVLTGILNCTVTALAKHQFGRSNVGESTLKTEVIDVSLMRVADPRQMTNQVRRRVVAALDRMARREIGHLQDDLD
ncbi:MAG: hypothetical protein QME77_12840, partial [bacterium]|nr:hypothetical protein [bacterium]